MQKSKNKTEERQDRNKAGISRICCRSQNPKIRQK
jgi:hypothetical protein